MEFEDARSKAHEFWVWERALEAGELERMRMEEDSHYNKNDRFFGLINEEIKLTRLEEIRQARWQKKVDDMREMCLNVKVTRPYQDEKGIFKDFIHKRPIL